ncbi:MAG: glycosyltransferase [Pseudobutyrivibrio sp.]|nr:glycosyltransferase [Pseudobutyrivibrio sp.]
MDDIRFSIITAVYNNKKYLENAVVSVMQQNYANLEYIVVDDGSTDGTGELADELSKQYKNLRVIHQENKWIYASFNEGIKNAVGEYIYILNSDDKLKEDALEILDRSIDMYNHPDVIWTKVLLCECDDNQNVINRIDIDENITEDLFWKDEADLVVWHDLLRSNLMVNQANLYKRSTIKKYEFRNDVYGADYLFNLEIAKYIESYLIISKPIYLFHKYRNGSNASIGKYYGYEHEMYNDFYKAGLELLNRRSIDSIQNKELIRKIRRANFTAELNAIILFDKSPINEKINYLKENVKDEVIDSVFDDKSEIERRIEKAIIRIESENTESK